uniref:Uncharacterized protein n=1 Tax=Timema monikensis TaxID=170555 RepID=A0A7R9HNL8_9NEOP|nr:unnamed protein product [Timema monikensis]
MQEDTGELPRVGGEVAITATRQITDNKCRKLTSPTSRQKKLNKSSVAVRLQIFPITFTISSGHRKSLSGKECTISTFGCSLDNVSLMIRGSPPPFLTPLSPPEREQGLVRAAGGRRREGVGIYSSRLQDRSSHPGDIKCTTERCSLS